jgi:hypothetical protein
MTALDECDWPDDDEFDWSGDDVVVQKQDQVAIYANSFGQVVIRAEADSFHAEDHWILFGREHALKVARRILDVAGFGDVTFSRINEIPGRWEDIELPEIRQADPEFPRAGGIQPAPVRSEPDFPAGGKISHGPKRPPIKERRACVAAALSRAPHRSNRAIAAECRISDKTVAEIRRAFESERGIPHTQRNGFNNMEDEKTLF